jgi:hypothetical protein
MCWITSQEGHRLCILTANNNHPSHHFLVVEAEQVSEMLDCSSVLMQVVASGDVTAYTLLSYSVIFSRHYAMMYFKIISK